MYGNTYNENDEVLYDDNEDDLPKMVELRDFERKIWDKSVDQNEI